MGPSCACALVDVLKSLLRVFEQEGGHVDAPSAGFFSPPESFHIFKTAYRSLWFEPTAERTGKGRVILAAHAIQRERGGGVQRPGRNWSKFGRSRSFFSSTTSTFELSDSIVA